MTPITHDQLFALKLSNASAQHLLRMLRIHGWPTVLTIDGKHFLKHS